MTIAVRAKVRKIRAHNVWSVTVYAEHANFPGYGADVVVTTFNHRYAMSLNHADAVKTALQLRTALELELMDEVHASRTARRAHAAEQHAAEASITEPEPDNLYHLEPTV